MKMFVTSKEQVGVPPNFSPSNYSNAFILKQMKELDKYQKLSVESSPQIQNIHDINRPLTPGNKLYRGNNGKILEITTPATNKQQNIGLSSTNCMKSDSSSTTMSPNNNFSNFQNYYCNTSNVGNMGSLPNFPLQLSNQIYSHTQSQTVSNDSKTSQNKENLQSYSNMNKSSQIKTQNCSPSLEQTRTTTANNSNNNNNHYNRFTPVQNNKNMVLSSLCSKVNLFNEMKKGTPVDQRTEGQISGSRILANMNNMLKTQQTKQNGNQLLNKLSDLESPNKIDKDIQRDRIISGCSQQLHNSSLPTSPLQKFVHNLHCVNCPSQIASYFVGDDDQQTPSFYCSQCSIQLAERGIIVRNLDSLFQNDDLVRNSQSLNGGSQISFYNSHSHLSHKNNKTSSQSRSIESKSLKPSLASKNKSSPQNSNSLDSRKHDNQQSPQSNIDIVQNYFVQSPGQQNQSKIPSTHNKSSNGLGINKKGGVINQPNESNQIEFDRFQTSSSNVQNHNFQINVTEEHFRQTNLEAFIKKVDKLTEEVAIKSNLLEKQKGDISQYYHDQTQKVDLITKQLISIAQANKQSSIDIIEASKQSALSIIQNYESQISLLLADLNKTRNDVCQNFSKILSKMESEPFRLILSQYNQQIFKYDLFNISLEQEKLPEVHMSLISTNKAQKFVEDQIKPQIGYIYSFANHSVNLLQTKDTTDYQIKKGSALLQSLIDRQVQSLRSKLDTAQKSQNGNLQKKLQDKLQPKFLTNNDNSYTDDTEFCQYKTNNITQNPNDSSYNSFVYSAQISNYGDSQRETMGNQSPSASDRRLETEDLLINRQNSQQRSDGSALGTGINSGLGSLNAHSNISNLFNSTSNISSLNPSNLMQNDSNNMNQANQIQKHLTSSNVDSSSLNNYRFIGDQENRFQTEGFEQDQGDDYQHIYQANNQIGGRINTNGSSTNKNNLGSVYISFQNQQMFENAIKASARQEQLSTMENENEHQNFNQSLTSTISIPCDHIVFQQSEYNSNQNLQNSDSLQMNSQIMNFMKLAQDKGNKENFHSNLLLFKKNTLLNLQKKLLNESDQKGEMTFNNMENQSFNNSGSNKKISPKVLTEHNNLNNVATFISSVNKAGGITGININPNVAHQIDAFKISQKKQSAPDIESKSKSPHYQRTLFSDSPCFKEKDDLQNIN